MLWLALHFPRLPLEAFPQASAQPESWAISNDACVLVCNPQAAVQGVRPGMSLSTAHALVPRLNYRQRDPAAEATALAAIATWAGQFTPNVSLEPPHALLLDIEGSLKLFGGIKPILRSLQRGLGEMRFSAAIACAPNTTAALLLARAGGGKIVNCKSTLAEAISALPVAVLDCDTATLQTFDAVGVKRIGDLLRLPRDGLARRFGQGLLDTIDRALGRLPAPREFFTSPASFTAKLELAVEVASSEALLFAAKCLLTQLAGFLAARNGAIQHCTFTLLHEDHADTMVEIGLVAPTRDPEHLVLLTRERLSALALDAPVRAIRLDADEILTLAADNRSLFPDHVNAAGEWQKLVERLRARLGAGAVHGLAPRAEHRPEYAWQTNEPGAKSMSAAFGPRPLWLLEAPQPLAEIACLPHYRHKPLTLVAGPERIESGWWDDDDVKRDYFIAQTRAQAMLWIYRERRAPGGWYLHGIFG